MKSYTQAVFIMKTPGVKMRGKPKTIDKEDLKPFC